MFNKVTEHVTHLLAFLLMRTLHATWRYEVIGLSNKTESLSKNGSSIYAVWHEFMFPCLIYESRHPTMMIASRSGGGRAIGRVMEYFNLKVTYGSSNRNGKDKGGKEAKLALIRALEKTTSAIITVDGSVGPRRLCKAGAVDLARKTGTPIVAFASVASSYWEFGTWDRLKLAKPFARVILSFERPFYVDEKTAGEAFAFAQLKVNQLINSAETNACQHLEKKYGIKVNPPSIHYTTDDLAKHLVRR